MRRWRKHKKHVFIMSSAGKPIFSRYGDEEKLNPIYGVMCSLVNFISEQVGAPPFYLTTALRILTCHHAPPTQDDTLRTIHAGGHKIVFLIRGPIYLVTASRTGRCRGSRGCPPCEAKQTFMFKFPTCVVCAM